MIEKSAFVPLLQCSPYVVMDRIVNRDLKLVNKVSLEEDVQRSLLSDSERNYQKHVNCHLLSLILKIVYIRP